MLWDYFWLSCGTIKGTPRVPQGTLAIFLQILQIGTLVSLIITTVFIRADTERTSVGTRMALLRSLHGRISISIHIFILLTDRAP